MGKQNILLLIAVLILLAIVVLFFDSISGLVTSYSSANVESVNPSILEFDRYDSSKVVNIIFDSGSDDVRSDFVLKSASTGEILDSGSLCDQLICNGRISKNFIVNDKLGSGKYYFEFDRICNNPECKNLNPKIDSGLLEIRHV